MVLEQLNLRHHLIGETGAHHKTRMSSSTTKIQQATFRQHDDGATRWKFPFINLWLDVDLRRALDLLQASHVNLIVKVTNVSNDGLVLHAQHLLTGDDVLVAGRGHEQIRCAKNFFKRDHFVAFHARLKRADWIDFRDLHAATLATQTLRATLAHIAITAHNGCFSAQHHVGGAHDSVHQ